MVVAPLAYKFVAVAVMLMEINFTADRLKLGAPFPITESQIKRSFIPDPSILGFAGRIDTDAYSFSFGKSGRLCYITKLQPGTPYSEGLQPPKNVSIEDHLVALSKRKSLIGTNEAYHLAKAWLTAIDVDVERLEKEQPVEVEQFVTAKKLQLPIFSIKWGKPEDNMIGGAARHQNPGRFYPRIQILIAGDSKSLLELRQEDISYSRRPALIKNIDQLRAISNEDFSKLTNIARQELIEKHRAASY